jgi:DNA-binding beta-propeller fold protein YncE
MNGEMRHNANKKIVNIVLLIFVVYALSYAYPGKKSHEKEGLQLMIEGETLYQDIKYSEALTAFRKAEKLLISRKYLARLYLNIARTCYALDDRPNTEEGLRKLFEMEPGHILDEQVHPRGFITVYNAVRSEILKKIAAGVIEVESNKVKKKKKFPLLLVLAGAVGAGIIAYLLLSKKKQTTSPHSIRALIKSTPDGAEVYVDGQSTGTTTPGYITLAPGRHEIRVRKEQYGQAREDIVFENNVNYTIQAQLSGYLYEFVAKWGRNLPYYTTWASPTNIAVDTNDDLYVSYESNWVHKFAADGSFIDEWRVKESTTFYNCGITVDRNNYVYVTGWGWRSGINEIRKFDSNGNLVIKWGSGGSGDGQFQSIRGIAVDADLYTYVADRGNGRVQKFDAKRNFIGKWNAGTSPSGIAVDKDGCVYVVDGYYNQIRKFDSGGGLISVWGSGGSGEGQFNLNYGGIAVDSNVYVFVADTYNNRIQKFDSDGNFITKWGSPGSDDGRFARPNDVAVDSVGCVYVADTMNDRIQKFGITDRTENNGEWKIDTSPAAASGVYQFRTIPAPGSQQRDKFKERQRGVR